MARKRKFQETRTNEDAFMGGCDINLSKKFDGGTVKEKLTDHIKKTLARESENHDRLVDKIERWNKMYRGIRDKKSWPFEGAANSAVPITRSLIDTVVVRIFDVIFGQKKLAIVKPKNELWQEIAPEIEDAVVKKTYEYPAYGQVRISNELRKEGVLVSSGGVRSIWQRHNLETFKKRLHALEEKAAKEKIVYTEAQLQALETAKRERENDPDEIETRYPGYLDQPGHLLCCIKQQTKSVTCLLFQSRI